MVQAGSGQTNIFDMLFIQERLLILVDNFGVVQKNCGHNKVLLDVQKRAMRMCFTL